MWGSECPVFYWRNETMPGCQSWLGELLGGSADDLAGFLGGNAKREIFEVPAPAREAVTIPGWVNAQFDHTRTVPVFDSGGVALSMDVYARLHHQYIERLQADATVTFADFVVEILDGAVS